MYLKIGNNMQQGVTRMAMADVSEPAKSSLESQE
jgi:hypothetical protein